MVKERILLTIAARGGSKGVKNKNLKNLCGLPLIAHTIIQAKKWGKADKIVCSTDSREIAKVALKYGAEVPFMRPPALATDTAGKFEVIRHCLKTVEEMTAKFYPIVIDLDATSPVRKITDIDGALRLFTKNRPKSVFSVVACRRNPYFNMVEVNAKGYAYLVKPLKSAVKRRQDAPKVYDLNASIYVYERKFILDKKSTSVLSDKSLIYIMNEYSAFDIDSESDFEFIEFLVEKGAVRL